MPIIEIATLGSPLSQGDILKDINLFATGEVSNASNGVVKKSPHHMCLVLTRPCGIEHKESVIVTGVEKLKDDVPRELDTLKKILSFLTNLRDGLNSPDVFYLGQLPTLPGRYGARFDDLHTIQIPPVGPDRQAFVDSKRIGALHPDFVRDLHARLFRAVASLGFDDYGWLSDSDLKWLVDCGQAELLHAQAETQVLKTQRSSQEAKGAHFDEKKLKDAESFEQKISESLRPYEEEYQLRALQKSGL